MSDNARLERALAATAAPERDATFVIAVLKRAEAERYRRERTRKVLLGAGSTAALAGSAALVGAWLIDQPGMAFSGAILSLALVMLGLRARLIVSAFFQARP